MIGWESGRHKLLVYSSDANFHVAGDGKLGGILEPNDMQCIISLNLDTKQHNPAKLSISQKNHNPETRTFITCTENLFWAH